MPNNISQRPLIWVAIVATLLSLFGCAQRESEEEITEMRSRDAAKPVEVELLTVSASRLHAQAEIANFDYSQVHSDSFPSFETSGVVLTSEQPVSTFSSDVDTAAYGFVRNSLNDGYLPPKDAIRLEEMINYFSYHYEKPSNEQQPFAVTTAVHPSPWQPQRKLVHIGVQGFSIENTEQPDTNLVFLLDVSGSMSAPNKLPLVKRSMQLLLNTLKPTDTVSVVVYAGAAGVVLPPTQVNERFEIEQAMQKLEAGGSTAGGAGIQLAYSLAETHFKEKGINRVILATDGDFNVGISDSNTLKDFIAEKRKTGIFLSVLGFGAGNYQDQVMQALAQNGNGVAVYIDTIGEAQKVLVDEASSTLFSIATDLKFQIEFNPEIVSEYRLLGYETRALAEEDFNNDNVDAGDIGSGHSVTAIYEISLKGSDATWLEPRRYSPTSDESTLQHSNELAFLKLRYKLPESDMSELQTVPILLSDELERLPQDMQQDILFSTSVAGFAQLLREAKYTEKWGFKEALALAQSNRGEDAYGYRSEFVQLVRKAQIARSDYY